MVTVTLASGRRFEAEPGSTLVDAAEAAGVGLPYSCRTGRCSTCRTKVLSGTTVPQVDEQGLTLEERAAGWVLGCVREATSDVVLEVEDLTGLDLPRPRTLPCRIDTIEDLAPDVRRFVLRLPPNAGFDFRPGQYVEVIGAGGLRRSYSLAAVDSARGHLTLHVRRVPEGAMSAYWFGTVQPNDLLRLHGPLGTFVLREVAGVEQVFLATGTGIAPVWAMLEQLAALPPEARPRTTHVIWGGRVPVDLYVDPRAAHPQVQYTPTLSRASPSWEGARAYVQDVLLASGVDLGNARVYACGSDTMIHAAREKLMAAGLVAGSFYSDAFVPSSQASGK